MDSGRVAGSHIVVEKGVYILGGRVDSGRVAYSC